MKNIKVFLSEKFQFLEMKFSIYLNRRVFVMIKQGLSYTSFCPLKIRYVGIIFGKKCCRCNESPLYVGTRNCALCLAIV